MVEILRLIFILYILGKLVFTTSFTFALSREDIDQEIIKYRTGSVTITLRGAHGEILSNRDVTVEMIRHAFLFGCNLYLWDAPGNDIEKQNLYRDYFVHLFNYATLPFYWSIYESSKGKFNDVEISNIALWCRANDIRTKGHPLIWHNLVPLWADYSQSEIDGVLESRVKGIIRKYRGLIDTFDVINESLDGPDYENSVGKWERNSSPVEAARRSISWAREQNPQAFLIINDHDTSMAYASQINVLKALGFAPDAIGIESHMHKGTWTDMQILNTVETLGRCGIPVHFTELTILSGHLKTDDDWISFHPGWESTKEGEEYQAQEAERIYRLLFSCSSVEAITWWDFSDYNSWQGAPSGLLRKDMTTKPAYEALERLIRHEWWTGPLHITSDKKGQISFRGFLGTYNATVGDKTASFNITGNKESNLNIQVKL
jgi:GH35 family endo-1,4-beta-xylanase